MKPSLCEIDNVYVVSRRMTYDSEIVNAESKPGDPFILRTDYDDGGYLSFILPLLQNSTYSFILKDQFFSGEFPDGNWIDSAIKSFRQTSSLGAISCSFSRQRMYGVDALDTDGSLFLETNKLRYILTMTDFERSSLSPFFFFSQALACKFNSRTESMSCSNYLPKESSSSSQVSQASQSFFYRLFHWKEKEEEEEIDLSKEIKQDCIAALGIQDVKCQSHRPQNRDIGVLLSQYKRSYIDEQLSSLLSGSMKPSEIIVFQNLHYKSYEKVLKKYGIKGHIWAVNWNSPFFLRHLIPLLMRSSYHIVFDDDIIPGHDTVKTLIDEIDRKDVPTGVGGRYIQTSNFPRGTYSFACVDCKPKRFSHRVDYVIQVYARKSIHTKVFWRYNPWTHRNGDDMHNSIAFVMECGRYPRRPAFLEDAVYKNYGTDAVASYHTRSHNLIRPKVVRSWMLAGFKPLLGRGVYDQYPDGYEMDVVEAMRTKRYF